MEKSGAGDQLWENELSRRCHTYKKKKKNQTQKKTKHPPAVKIKWGDVSATVRTQRAMERGNKKCRAELGGPEDSSSHRQLGFHHGERLCFKMATKCMINKTNLTL